MTVTGRVPLVLLLGIGALVVRPSAGTALWWVVAVLLLVALDLLLATTPGTLEVTRRPVSQVRQGETTPADLLVLNTGRRRVRGVLRDAWQPSAGAHANRHRIDLAAGDQVRLTTPLTPTRRGDRQAGRITVRSIGPLGLAGRQRSRVLPGTRPRAAGLPLPQAPAEPARAAPRARRPGRGAGPRPGDGVRLAAGVRPRRRRPQHRLARQRAHPDDSGADLAARAAAPGAAGARHLPHLGGARRRRPPAGLLDGRRAAARGARRPRRGHRRLRRRRPAGAGPGPRRQPHRRAAAAGRTRWPTWSR